ncbi:MAG: M20/M25/M40 family metallo-hydrolase, partial [Microgenomates group bacterium]
NIYKTYKQLLNEAVRFKSVSTDPKYLGEIEKMVSWLKNTFEDNSFKVKILKSKEANPVVFAEYKVSSDLETILIYGHYDVQPAEKSDGWMGEPFKLFEKGKKIYARGILDNKGQVLIHIATAICLAKENKLKYNIKFLIEGNEETGNASLSSIMRKHKKELACDVVLISDGEMANNGPTVEISLRGGFNSTLIYKTAKNNVHSGIFGGAIPNAAQELTKFLSKLYDKNNSVGFKEFYSDVDKVNKDQLNNNKSLLKGSEDLAKLAGVQTLLTETGYDFFTQTGLRPTIQVTGIKSGYIDSGYANIVPATAEARINFRIVSSQDAKKVAETFKSFVKKNTPNYVEYTLSFGGLHNPIKIDTNNKYVKEIEKVLENVYGQKVARKNVGGAIPFVADVKGILGADAVLIPLGNEDCNMHGANENFDLELIQKGLQFSSEFMCHSSKFYRPLWKTKTKVVKGQT